MLQTSEPRIGVLLQGRMSSRRLPGKVLMRLGSRTLLQHLVDGCRQVVGAHVLCVATSVHATDDVIASHCAELSVECYRGLLDDVAARLLGAAAEHQLDALVRISADSPLIHPRLIERLISRFRAAPKCDLATNVLRRTYPSGMSVEVIRTTTLDAAHSLMNAEEREHVTRYFYANQDAYRIVAVERDEPLDAFKMSIDDRADFERIEALFERLDMPHWMYSIEQLTEMAYRTEITRSLL